MDQDEMATIPSTTAHSKTPRYQCTMSDDTHNSLANKSMLSVAGK
jgi:hypothetical protein